MNNIKIVFLGSNGAGKTTLLNYTKEQFEKKGRSVDIFNMGWKNFQNPLLNLISKKVIKAKNKEEIKENRLKRFRPRSWFFYLIYYFELLSRYSRIKKSKKEIILMDRYFYDELMFAKKLKFRFFRSITPIPDLCFVLRAPLKTIRKRGHIASDVELKRFYFHIRVLSNYFPMTFLDSSKPVRNLYNELINNLKKLGKCP